SRESAPVRRACECNNPNSHPPSGQIALLVESSPSSQTSGQHKAYNTPAIMDERIQNLNEKAKTLPKSPGVYLMKDDKGRVIYVGKASSLRDRVCSYFQPSTKLESLKAELIQHVVDFETLETASEVE